MSSQTSLDLEGEYFQSRRQWAFFEKPKHLALQSGCVCTEKPQKHFQNSNLIVRVIKVEASILNFISPELFELAVGPILNSPFLLEI